ncbi:glutamate receptor ionotropic, kainate 2 [Caerostris darwini]|uniref:Glutamate receptor ionotropic, kainate 2 n=1 Tax=Caerostris darwini TaxID=1538125 RepID=A0AAV4NCW6_9ARAC|nr:glutamate receptor ionotropic, kainate 2 [Caerostris darwini]
MKFNHPNLYPITNHCLLRRRTGSPYRTPLSSAILKLQESGTLHIMKDRWWKQRLGGGKCSKDETNTAGSASALSLANVGGVFVVLGAGLVAACIVAIVEFVWKSRKVDSEEREPLCVMFCRELRFAIFCGGSTKPILPKNSPDDRQAPENGLPFMPLTGFSSVTTKDNFS